MKLRFVILVLILVFVVGATAWRATHPRKSVPVSLDALNVRPAPEFQLLDQNNRPIQLKGYLGRHRILIAFFDAKQGPNADPLLRRLRDVHSELKRAGFIVLAISTPMGPDHKPEALSYPFPILRDTVAGQPDSCCVLWGRTPEVTESTRLLTVTPALFLIEADGSVSWDKDFPRPAAEPESLINALVTGQE